MMAEPRRSTKFRAHFPGPLGFEMLERPSAAVADRAD
jgi:hypothetical protein